jgi:PAS domain S-box-containing protein
VVESAVDTWVSIDSVRLVCLGISLYVAALHLTLARNGHAANRWVAVWGLATALIQLTQVSWGRGDLADRVLGARAAIATVPMLVGSLVFVVRSLGARRIARGEVAGLVLGTLGFAAVAIATPLFIADAPRIAAGPAMPLIGLVLAGAFVAMVREARVLERYDRGVLWASLAVYVGVSLLAVVHAMLVPRTPFATGIGTALAAVGLSHLVVGHERRRARVDAERGVQALAASEARLRELVERAPIGIISCDRTGQILTVNPRMWQMFDAPERVRRGRLGNLLDFERDERPDQRQLVRRVLETGETHTGEIAFTPRWGGRAMEVRFTLTPLRAANGEVNGVVVLSEDVSERNDLERQLRLAQKMEAVGQLAAGIAHEINTPMAYVRSNLRALHEDWSALRGEIRKNAASEETARLLAGAEELIDESLEGVERTIAIARDMREFAHSASATREPTDLNHELETCVRLAATQRPGVRLSESYEPLPPLSASAGQLRQVFLNLLVNALQAVSEQGQVAVSSARDGRFAVVRVRDDGCGIPHEIQHRLFEPFFTTKPADQGTGLGLYISYEIVRAHGGEIRVESAPAAGSTFEVRLPLESA